jgi:hypothetical protein
MLSFAVIKIECPLNFWQLHNWFASGNLRSAAFSFVVFMDFHYEV